MKNIKKLQGILVFTAALALVALFFIVGAATLNIARMSKQYLDNELKDQTSSIINTITKSKILKEFSTSNQEKIFFVDKNSGNSFEFKCIFKTTSGNPSCSSRAIDIPFNDVNIINNFSDLQSTKVQQYTYTDPQTNRSYPITINIEQTNYAIPNSSKISVNYDLKLTATSKDDVNHSYSNTTNIKITKSCPALLPITNDQIPYRIKNLTDLGRNPQMIPLNAMQLKNLSKYNSVVLPVEYPNLYCTCSIGKTLTDGTCLICKDGYYLRGNVCNSCAGINNATCSYNEVNCNAGYTKTYDKNNNIICKLCVPGTYCTGMDNVDYCLKNTTITKCSEYSNETNTCKACDNNYYIQNGVLELNLMPTDSTLLQSNKIYFSKSIDNKLLYTVVDGSTPKKTITVTTDIDTTVAPLTLNFLNDKRSTISDYMGIKNHIPNRCVPCPSNAICNYNNVTCKQGFISAVTSGKITACNCPGTGAGASAYYSDKPQNIGDKVVATDGGGGCYCDSNKYWNRSVAIPACTSCPGTGAGASTYYINPPASIGEAAVANKCYCPFNKYWNSSVTPPACTSCPGTGEGASAYYSVKPQNIGDQTVGHNGSGGCYCPSNKYWNSSVGTPACTSCPGTGAGASKYYTNPPTNIGEAAVANKCYCPSNKYWDSSATPPACTSCPVGSQYYNQANLPLDIGGVAFSNKCYCNSNYYWNSSVRQCIECKYYWDSSNNACKQCPANSTYSGTIISGRNRITNSNCYCKANLYWDNIDKNCIACPNGSTYSSTVLRNKSPIFNTNCYCNSGYWTGVSPKNGYCSTSCGDNADFYLQPPAGVGAKVSLLIPCYCRTGFYLSSEGKCLNNDALNCFQKSLTANACANCHAGYRINNNTCTACPAGSVSHDGDTSCTACGAGQKPNANSSACIPCEAGSVSAGGLASCTLCEAGQKPNANSSACIACEAGKYSGVGANNCENCPGTGVASCNSPTGYTITCLQGYGLRGNSGASNASCYLCGPGSYSAGGTSDCNPCVPGTYSDTSGAYSCSNNTAADCFERSTTSNTCTSCRNGYVFPIQPDGNCYRADDYWIGLS